MYHLDDEYFARFNQPSSSSVQFPSETARFGGYQPQNTQKVYNSHQERGSPRIRSHSADTRRAIFQRPTHTFSEEEHLSSGNNFNLKSADVQFPSQHRRSASTTQWLQDESVSPPATPQSFTEHLRERSPASGSALLNLLSRYPSAQNSIHNSPSIQAYLERIQHSEPSTQLRTNQREDTTNGAGTTLVYHNESTNFPSTYNQRIQTTFTRNGPISTTFNNHDNNNSTFLNQIGSQSKHLDEKNTNYLINSDNSKHQTYSNNSKNIPEVKEYRYPKDNTNQLELIAAQLLDDNMSRSTSEWNKSFGQLQNRFQTLENRDPSPPAVSYVSSGSFTLPRRLSQPISKSSSNYEMNQSVLSLAVERRAAEAPEPRRSGALDNFWSQTISSRPSSPTVQRIAPSLTAAERLQMLQEPVETDRRQPQRVGSGAAVAARKAQLLTEPATEMNNQPRFALNPSFPANSFLLNFNELDNAVDELHKAAKNNDFVSSKRVGGCARFPTGEHALSPPPIISGQKCTSPPKIHSPTPPEETSDSSSIYQIPTGLPHPKPKHNVKEQLYLAGIQSPSYHMSRTMYRSGPNFPVPTTGSVASRITEFEKRPGTPIMQTSITSTSTTLNNHKNDSSKPQGGSMSPRSAVFRAKPVIHVELGTTSINQNTSNQYEPSPPLCQRQEQTMRTKTISNQYTVPIVKNIQQQPKQYNSTHSMFDFKSNNISSASTTQIQADVSPTKSHHLAELHVSSPPERTSSANSSLINGSAETNNSKSQSDLNFASDLTVGNYHSARDFQLNDFIGEQYRPTSKTLPPLIKSSKPNLVAPKEPIYYPQGKPVPPLQNDAALRRVCEVFRNLPGQKCELENMRSVCEAAGLPLYWKMPIFMAITNDENRPATQVDFTSWWKAMTSVAHDEAARFVYTLTMGCRSYLVPEDLYHLIMDIIHTHPGLAFYRDATEFHDKYCQVVMTRIFWNDAHSWSGRLTTERLRRGGVLQAIRDLAEDDDINKSLRYFSYEHFYVVYCKFWEIDTDHDLKICKNDLAAHAGGALPDIVVDRIFSGAVCMAPSHGENIEEIGLPEFTQFLLAEEDKTHPTSVEYWFRILDLDGDGIVTLYDMELFHNQIKKKLSVEGIDSMAFTDVACQLIDMLNIDGATCFRLKDLKKSPLRGRLINTFVNWRKFFVQETNEVSEAPRIEDEGGVELTDWDRYCIEEYEAMMEDDQADAETISLNLEEDEGRAGLAYHDLL